MGSRWSREPHGKSQAASEGEEGGPLAPPLPPRRRLLAREQPSAPQAGEVRAGERGASHRPGDRRGDPPSSRRGRMSFHAVGWAARLRGLQPHQKLVLLMLAERSDVDTNMTWPSYALIAADTGLSRRTCIAVCSQLEALGLITASARAVQGRQTSNQYEVHVGSNPKGAPAAPHGAPAAPPGGAPAAPPGGAPAAP
ncbi:MAG: helix-turn-helix domain-containing protein, partial [Thauera sp.]|nr:helix-turn-helix domain-containing protein [Thauera sp.]